MRYDEAKIDEPYCPPIPSVERTWPDPRNGRVSIGTRRIGCNERGLIDDPKNKTSRYFTEEGLALARASAERLFCAEPIDDHDGLRLTIGSSEPHRHSGAQMKIPSCSLVCAYLVLSASAAVRRYCHDFAERRAGSATNLLTFRQELSIWHGWASRASRRPANSPTENHWSRW